MTTPDPAVMDGLRSSLEEHRARLHKEIADQGVDPDSEDLAVNLERGFADGGHATAERGHLIALVRELRSSLREVERALAKMDKGIYGLCERCGDPIAPERLEAIPWARLCISCKQKAR
jgi:RNA polymerase-binding transcription factor DksA